MKTKMIQIDKAGRLVLPKPLREQFNLEPGDKLKLSVEGTTIKLEPVNVGAEFVRKGTVLVFTGEFVEPVTTRKVEDLLAQERKEGLAPTTGKLQRK